MSNSTVPVTGPSKSPTTSFTSFSAVLFSPSTSPSFSSSLPSPSPSPSSTSAAPTTQEVSSTSRPPTSSTSPSSAPPPSSTVVAPAVPTTPTTTAVTSVVTTAPAGTSAAEPTTVTLTSTSGETHSSTTPFSSTSSSTTSSTSSSTSDATPLGNSTAPAHGGGGLKSGGKIAVAVIVPLVAVALIGIALLFLWRRRKQKKDAEELRRNEMEEYGYNPNNDPTLPAVGTASSTGEEPSGSRPEDGSGYRGWGTTQGSRKLSTTLSNGNGPIGVALSDGSGQHTGYASVSPASSPTHPATSEAPSGDPLLTRANRPTTADSETIGELGGAPVAGTRRDIHRGPSNASSSYSAANRSDVSTEAPFAGGGQSVPPFSHDGLYVDGGNYRQQGPYAEGQPVIRDVQARRNTRIENPSVFPQQGNAGIAQNF